MHYFRFHAGDYVVQTRGLTMQQRGALVDLQCLYFSTERPLTTNRRRLFDLLGITKKSERDAVEWCLATFFSKTPEGFVNRRWDPELVKLQRRVEAARRNGLQGGRPSKSESQSVMGLGADKPVTGTADDDFGNPVGLPNGHEIKPNGFDDENPGSSLEETQSVNYASLPNHKPPLKAKEETLAESVPRALSNTERTPAAEHAEHVNESQAPTAGLQGGGVPTSLARANAVGDATVRGDETLPLPRARGRS